MAPIVPWRWSIRRPAASRCGSSASSYDLSAGADVSTDGLSFKAYGNVFLTQKNRLAGGFVSTGFQSYDALDRVVSSYTFPPCPFVARGIGQIFCSNAPVATTNSYDTNNAIGFLTSTVDPLGQSKNYAYNLNLGLAAIQYGGDSGVTVARSLAYDLDGRATSLTMRGRWDQMYAIISHQTLINSILRANGIRPDGERVTSKSQDSYEAIKDDESLFVLYFSSKADANRAALTITSDDILNAFSSHVSSSTSGWLLRLNAKIRGPSSDIQLRLTKLAADFGGSYDGFEMPVTRGKD